MNQIYKVEKLLIITLGHQRLIISSMHMEKDVAPWFQMISHNKNLLSHKMFTRSLKTKLRPSSYESLRMSYSNSSKPPSSLITTHPSLSQLTAPKQLAQKLLQIVSLATSNLMSHTISYLELPPHFPKPFSFGILRSQIFLSPPKLDPTLTDKPYHFPRSIPKYQTPSFITPK